MLFKKQEEPKKTELLGEDFDVFPDMGDRPVKREATELAPESDDTPEPEPSPFEQKIAAIEQEKWKHYQIIGGIALGVLSGLSLTVLNRVETFSSFSLIVAVVLALLVPNIFEKKAGRKIPVARTALIITLAAFLGIYLLYGLVLDPGFFKNP